MTNRAALLSTLSARRCFGAIFTGSTSLALCGEESLLQVTQPELQSGLCGGLPAEVAAKTGDGAGVSDDFAGKRV